jgi:hypothetical protein
MSLEKYLKSFSRLRTDKNRKHRLAPTTFQAPFKSFLLLMPVISSSIGDG